MFRHLVDFKGGSKAYNQGNYKFHLYVTTNEGEELHLWEALKKGVAEKVYGEGVYDKYSIAYPVVKLFTSTSGFGVPKEYFSFFVLVCSEGELMANNCKRLNIKPLGFQSIDQFGFHFSTVGRFLTEEEIKRLYGATSNTYKYYMRQSFVSKRRLLEMVTASPITANAEELISKPRVRKLRLR